MSEPELRTRGFHADLAARGLVHQCTSTELPELMQREALVGYIGFDPTATSLHVGSLLQVLALVRLQRAGHHGIALVGGGTGLIGDPSGKATERAMLTREKLDENIAGMRAQLERFLDFSGKFAARLVDNAEWLGKVGLLEFLREIGKNFTVNAMMHRDSVRMRLEDRDQGISFTEFSYGLMQAYDFLVLHERFGCRLQIGGSDQWGNIVDGVELIRRKRGVTAFGLTQPLVTKSDGTKFGKTESGTIWLDPALTSPFQFYQFWLNVDDADAVRYLAYFTFLEMSEIEDLARQVAAQPEQRAAQRVLARDVVRLVHGEDALQSALRVTGALFGEVDIRDLSATELEDAFEAAPRSPLDAALLGTESVGLLNVLAESGLAPSRGRARQMVEQSSISINGTLVVDARRVLAAADLLHGRFIVLRRGKKNYHVLDAAPGR